MDECRVQRRAEQGLGLGRAQFQEIPQDGIVLDAQRRAALGDEALFEPGDHPAAVVAQGPGLVQFGPNAAGGRSRRRGSGRAGRPTGRPGSRAGRPGPDDRPAPARSIASTISAGGWSRGPGAAAISSARAAPAARPVFRVERSRGPPRPSARRATARPMSPAPFSAARTSRRSDRRSRNHCTASSRASMAAGDSSGRAMRLARRRAPGAVTVRSIEASRLPSRPPPWLRSISSEALVAGSMLMASASPARLGGRSAGSLPPWVASRWAAIRPRAAISAPASCPKPSRVSTP